MKSLVETIIWSEAASDDRLSALLRLFGSKPSHPSSQSSDDRLKEIIAERILRGFSSFRFEEFQQDIEDFATGSDDALTKDQMKKHETKNN